MKKILVVGYGSIGKRHIENLLSISNLEVIVCTKRKDIGKLLNVKTNKNTHVIEKKLFIIKLLLNF